MTGKIEPKRERMHLRLDARSKRKLERAATYEETSITQFVLSNAVEAAERVIEARERIVLFLQGQAVCRDMGKIGGHGLWPVLSEVTQAEGHCNHGLAACSHISRHTTSCCMRTRLVREEKMPAGIDRPQSLIRVPALE